MLTCTDFNQYLYRRYTFARTESQLIHGFVDEKKNETKQTNTKIYLRNGMNE